MIDRFGLLPDMTRHLFETASLRNTAENLGIQKIDMAESGGYILFNESPAIDAGAIIELIQQESKTYKLDGQSKLKINHATDNPVKRIQFLRALLDRLQLKQAA